MAVARQDQVDSHFPDGWSIGVHARVRSRGPVISECNYSAIKRHGIGAEKIPFAPRRKLNIRNSRETPADASQTPDYIRHRSVYTDGSLFPANGSHPVIKNKEIEKMPKQLRETFG